MAFKLKHQSGAPVVVTMNVPASTTILKDQLLAIDTTNKGLIPATGSSTVLTILAVAQDAVTSSASVQTVRAILVEPGQIWEADCTSNTAATHIGIRHALTSGVAVANTTSDTAGTTGVALMTKVVGAAADKKAEFKLLAVGQVTA